LNKKELIDSIADVAEIDKTTAQKALDSTLMSLSKSLKKGDTIALVGFGTFSVSKREARQGKNPQNGDVIHIPAKNVVRFKPGKNLSEKIN
jgi:DNA-binding protein HU-beta